MKFLMPTILIGLSIALFFAYTSPLYGDVVLLREEMTAYNEALNNSKALEKERDKLTQKYNAIGGENLNKLQKLLPESVDNIRLVLELEKIALPYGRAIFSSSKTKRILSTLSGNNFCNLFKFSPPIALYF